MTKALKFLALTAVAVLGLATAAPSAHAQVSVGVQVGGPPVAVGVAPICPYGYFDYAPYSCAPYGYYGPQWFNGGIFLGAGPWFRGPRGFHGYVNRRFDPHYGYRGPMPGRGEGPRPGYRPGNVPHFRGNEVHDGHGRVGGGNYRRR